MTDPFPPFDGSVARARDFQEAVRRRVRIVPVDLSRIRTVCAADATHLPDGSAVAAALVVVELEGGRVVDEAFAVVPITFPYVPGYLAFREGPAVLAAFGRLAVRPDALLFDGQGIAHPRRCGIAAHVGVLLDLPSVGCAKSRLVGDFDPPGRERGDRSPLTIDGEEVGAVLRTRSGVSPVYVSPGHRADIPTSVELVMRLCSRYRLPDAARLAHGRTQEIRKGRGEGAVPPAGPTRPQERKEEP